jgi:hypothetical protein
MCILIISLASPPGEAFFMTDDGGRMTDDG